MFGHLPIIHTASCAELWAVVNNAGIACSSEIEWCPISTFQQQFDVNTLGPVRVTKAFLPLLRESQGRIVIVASVAGKKNVQMSRQYDKKLSSFNFLIYLNFLFECLTFQDESRFRDSHHTQCPSMRQLPSPTDCVGS